MKLSEVVPIKQFNEEKIATGEYSIKDFNQQKATENPIGLDLNQ